MASDLLPNFAFQTIDSSLRSSMTLKSETVILSLSKNLLF